MVHSATSLTFSPENKSSRVYDSQRIEVKNGEKKRIVILDKAVKMRYTHYISAGEASEDGRRRGKFVTCLGREEVMASDGRDPESCPACARAESGRDVSVAEARRRFVCNAMEYVTNAAGEPTTDPVVMQAKVWVFGDDKFNRLIDMQKEYDAVTGRDLVLTGISEKFKSMNIDVGGKNLFALAKNKELCEKQMKHAMSQFSSDIDKLLSNDMPYDQLERFVESALNATPAYNDQDAFDVSNAMEKVAQSMDKSVNTKEDEESQVESKNLIETLMGDL